MAVYKYYKPDFDIENTIQRWFDRIGSIHTNPIPDNVKNHLDIAFDNGARWGEIKINLYLGRFVTTMWMPYPTIECIENHDHSNIICVVTCEAEGINIIRSTRSIDDWGQAARITKALVGHTLDILYGELIKNGGRSNDT